MPDPTPVAPWPRFAVFGAGAVGGYYGALLARAGVPVVLIGRPAHVQAMRERGLRLQTATFDETIAVQADTDPAAVTGADVVLVCVKSGDTEAAAAALRPHLGPDTAVLSLQNGVDNAERLGRVLGRPVVPVVVYVAAGPRRCRRASAPRWRRPARGRAARRPSPRHRARTYRQRAVAAPAFGSRGR